MYAIKMKKMKIMKKKFERLTNLFNEYNKKVETELIYLSLMEIL